MPTDNQQRLRNLTQPRPEIARARLVMDDGTELPFDGRFHRDISERPRAHKPGIKTPREDEIDMDGAKTHRVVCLLDTKVAIDGRNDPRTSYIRLGDMAWVTGDIAHELERKGLAKVVEERDPPAEDDPPVNRDPAAALAKPQPIGRQRTVSAAQKAARQAAAERMRNLAAAKRAERDASASE